MNFIAMLKGVRDAFPIVLGYLPVAIAFGMSGSSLGIGLFELFLTSFILYAGAAQFFILASIALGTPLSLIVVLVSLLNARHLFYGAILNEYFPKSLKHRLSMAFLLTDEVFATAFHHFKNVPTTQRTQWYWGVGLTAWLTWFGGTIIGVVAGEQLLAYFPVLEKVLKFSLPALFITLTVLTIRGGMLFALSIGAFATLVFMYLEMPSIAIIAGAFVSFLCYRPQRGKGKTMELKQ